jgi:UMF1 family MFS transporter
METTVNTPLATSKKTHRAWAMYDWANSAYNLVITSTIFPDYYTGVTTPAGTDPNLATVNIGGWSVSNSVLYNYAAATAYLIIALITPILTSIADYKGNKKSFMRFFCYLGSMACACLFFFKEDTVELGIICFIIAAIGFCGSLVFYNAYLPEIAAPNERDKVSAQGFSYGYIGSVLLQLICFVFVLKADWFGISVGMGCRISFVLVAVWWFSFAHIPFAKLPRGVAQTQHPEHNIFANGFIELRKVWAQAKKLVVLRTYLVAFFMYSMGVQTVMLAATLFGKKEMQMETGQLIATILIIQLVAIAGAYLMSGLSKRFGNLRILLFVVFIWIAVCIAAYFITSPTEFYVVAAVVGLVMGGIQSLSRSTYAKLMPPTQDTASFFSFYDVTEKIAIVIGMFSFGFIEQITGNMRNSIIALITFFAIGAIILYLAIRLAKKHTKAMVNA